MTTELTRSHETATIERFQRDPDFAVEYLAAVLADGDKDEIAQALERIEKSLGKRI